jgi:hypothetical protein
VGIVTGSMAGGRLPAGESYVPLLQSIQTACGAHLASYPGTGDYCLRVKRPGREADLLFPSSYEVKNGGAIPSLP